MSSGVCAAGAASGGRDRERRERREERSEQEDADDFPTKNGPNVARKSENAKQERERIFAAFRRLSAIRDSFNSELRQRHAPRNGDVFRVHRARRPQRAGADRQQLHVSQRTGWPKHYGIEGVDGDEMRRVELPEDSPRGGLLTQGTLLVVTSNPTRTSPVKRGLYILDNILGTPPPPPPPDIPPLEQAAEAVTGHEPTVRELQEIHRRDPLCHSCHARMDPLGPGFGEFQRPGNVAGKRARPADRRLRHAADGRRI